MTATNHPADTSAASDRRCRWGHPCRCDDYCASRGCLLHRQTSDRMPLRRWHRSQCVLVAALSALTLQGCAFTMQNRVPMFGPHNPDTMTLPKPPPQSQWLAESRRAGITAQQRDSDGLWTASDASGLNAAVGETEVAAVDLVATAVWVPLARWQRLKVDGQWQSTKA